MSFADASRLAEEDGGMLKITGVTYEIANMRWVVRWSESGERKSKGFPVKRYCTEGMSFADASRLAQEAAVRHRKALEQSRKCGFTCISTCASCSLCV